MSGEISDLDRAMLLVEIATDLDEPSLTPHEAATLAASLLRHAAAERLVELALASNEAIAEDVATMMDDLLECAEITAPEAFVSLRRLERLGRAVENLGRLR